MTNSPKNIFYAQSGGATAVINATACGVIETARQYQDRIGHVYVGHNGIIGAINEELFDTRMESDASIEALRYTPACAFGSCRYRLKDHREDDREYRRIFDVFAAHNIGYCLYNGGGDSQETSYKIVQASKALGYPLQVIGLPKTIDNDLPGTDNSPGFASVAKYIATSAQETALDLASMASASTKVFILEVMGRHAGWIAAAGGLASRQLGCSNFILLFPENAFDPQRFLKKVESIVKEYGSCVVVVSEGVRDARGHLLHEADNLDAFGHEQLGGVAVVLSRLIKKSLGYKNHYAIADYMQRAARHLASQVDVDQAYALGKAAVEYCVEGESEVMLAIQREMSEEYRWGIAKVPLDQVASVEQVMPRDFISEDGFDITEACYRYLWPLIQGEAYVPFINGLPAYVPLKGEFLKKKLQDDCVEA